MSTGTEWRYSDAVKIAERISELLKPICTRSKAVGSVRRRKSYVKDIEFLVEPLRTADLLGSESYDHELIKTAMSQHGKIVKAGERYIQLEHILGHEGLKLDLFLIYPPANWYAQMAIRTGPAKLGHLCTMQFRANNLFHTDGRLTDAEGNEIPISSEEEWFAYARLPYMHPWQRDGRDASRPLPPSDAARALLREACE